MSQTPKRDWIYLTFNGGKPVTLTKRQQQVLDLIASGYRTKEIAYKLSLKPETVSMHLSAIRKKLGARTNVEALCKSNYLLKTGFGD